MIIQVILKELSISNVSIDHAHLFQYTLTLALQVSPLKQHILPYWVSRAHAKHRHQLRSCATLLQLLRRVYLDVHYASIYCATLKPNYRLPTSSLPTTQFSTFSVAWAVRCASICGGRTRKFIPVSTHRPTLGTSPARAPHQRHDSHE